MATCYRKLDEFGKDFDEALKKDINSDSRKIRSEFEVNKNFRKQQVFIFGTAFIIIMFYLIDFLY